MDGDRRASRTLGQHRSTQRKVPCGQPDEDWLTVDIIELTREFGRYGYRMITGMGQLNSIDVVDALTDLFVLRGPSEYIRSESPVGAPPIRATAGDAAEFIAKKVWAWIGAAGAKTAFIAPGSPWENGYYESFNARFRPSRRCTHRLSGNR